jgi:hypothetical protein
MNKGSPSRPGVFELDSVRRAVVYDLSDRPELWHGSMMDLVSLINRIVYRRPGERPLGDTDPATAVMVLELIGHFRQEYDSFLTRYGSVPRPMPGMAADEPWTTAEEKRRAEGSARGELVARAAVGPAHLANAWQRSAIARRTRARARSTVICVSDFSAFHQRHQA